jgi:hypothetical protein
MCEAHAKCMFSMIFPARAERNIIHSPKTAEFVIALATSLGY